MNHVHRKHNNYKTKQRSLSIWGEMKHTLLYIVVSTVDLLSWYHVVLSPTERHRLWTKRQVTDPFLIPANVTLHYAILPSPRCNASPSFYFPKYRHYSSFYSFTLFLSLDRIRLTSNGALWTAFDRPPPLFPVSNWSVRNKKKSIKKRSKRPYVSFRIPRTSTSRNVGYRCLKKFLWCHQLIPFLGASEPCNLLVSQRSQLTNQPIRIEWERNPNLPIAVF